MGVLKRIADRLSGKETNPQKLLRLKSESAKALNDLKCVLGDAIAQSHKHRKLVAVAEAKIQNLQHEPNQSQLDSLNAQYEQYKKLYNNEEVVCSRIRSIMTELKERMVKIDLAMAEYESSSRQASANRIAAEIVKDFGKEFSINFFLENISEESFKIAYDSENKLLIEQKIASIGK